MQELQESKNENSIEEIEIIKEKIQELDNSYSQYKQLIPPFKSNQIEHPHPFQNHPEIFFSLKELENINFLKLMSDGFFGKVYEFFEYIKKFKIKNDSKLCFLNQ